MTTLLSQLTSEIVPDRTVLFFGSGSSLPSGAPSVATLEQAFIRAFKLEVSGFSLAEVASLAEAKARERKSMIKELRSHFRDLRPTGGLLNLPLYKWKSIFTTNYDELIEATYSRAKSDITVFDSNFDFTIHSTPAAAKLFKLHGTISKDISDGNVSRIIISEADYDHTEDYRERLFDRLKSDLAGSHLVIIGHSLSDKDVKEEIARAISLNAQAQGSGKISLLLYTRDEDRAGLFERRGIQVAFGGIDEFFAELAKSHKLENKTIISDNLLDRTPALLPVTVDVQHASDIKNPDVSRMFSGWPANYAEIVAGLTFERSIVDDINQYLTSDSALTAVILGASGVGKTTAARQLQLRCLRQGKLCWEHKVDQFLSADYWSEVMTRLRGEKREGVLFVDDAHSHLQQINELVDRASLADNGHLKLVLVSSRNHWYPRVKTPNLYKYGREWVLSKLATEEVERLLQLVDTNTKIRNLVEPVFSGFSRQERRRRLIDRCEKDFFVCLRNIFASESLDDIILREFAQLASTDQDIYRYVAAMEHAGIRVHRQLIVRLLAIPTASIPAVLQNLLDVVHEEDENVRDGIFTWKTRHATIAGIIAKFKFSDIGKTIDLFDKVIESINPTYEIEIRTIRELCNIESGLPRIPNKNDQNRLLRKMMSVAPGERVPRHRLIRNLIQQGDFEKADTEIRIFNKDFGADGPVFRYRVNLLVARAKRTPGILDEDRIVILEQARELAVVGVERYSNRKDMLGSYAELGIEYYRRTGKYTIFDEAIKKLRDAEDRLGDPDISKMLLKFERRIAGQRLDVVGADAA